MSELNFTHSNGNKVKLTTPDTLAANRTFKLPGADGTAGQTLKTDASGALSFTTTSKTTTPAFMYTGSPSSGTKDGVSDVVHSFSRVLHDVGNDYLNANGRFTAPVTGLYHLGFTLFDGTSNGNVRVADIHVYDSGMNQLLGDSLLRLQHVNHSTGSETFSGSCIAPLNATDRVYLLFTGTITGSTPRSCFWGYLVGH